MQCMYFRMCISVGVCLCKGLCGETQRDTRIYLIPLSLLVIYCELFGIHNIHNTAKFPALAYVCIRAHTYACKHVCLCLNGSCMSESRCLLVCTCKFSIQFLHWLL